MHAAPLVGWAVPGTRGLDRPRSGTLQQRACSSSSHARGRVATCRHTRPRCPRCGRFSKALWKPRGALACLGMHPKPCRMLLPWAEGIGPREPITVPAPQPARTWLMLPRMHSQAHTHTLARTKLAAGTRLRPSLWLTRPQTHRQALTLPQTRRQALTHAQAHTPPVASRWATHAADSRHNTRTPSPGAWLLGLGLWFRWICPGCCAGDWRRA